MDPALEDARTLLADASQVAFLTGAGISAGAGLPTYRGAGGMYTSGGVTPLTVASLSKDKLPALWAHVDLLHQAASAASPTLAHRAIARFSSERSVTVVTQNIDGLHLQAGGALTLIELHGHLRTVSCKGRAHCFDYDVPQRNDSGVPVCPECSSVMRPDVVLFGQRMDGFKTRAAEAAALEAEVLVVVGTSLEVYPAAGLVDARVKMGLPVINVNLEAFDRPWVFDVIGPADEVLPALLA